MTIAIHARKPDLDTIRGVTFGPAIVVCPGEGWKPDGTDCATCRRPLTGRLKWVCRSAKWFGKTTWWCRDLYFANHQWHDARRIALARSGGCCVMCGGRGWMEVDHIVSRNGMGYGLGCHHHQDGLQPLCHSCHVAIGIARRGGWAAKKAPLRERSMRQREALIAAGQQEMRTL